MGDDFRLKALFRPAFSHHSSQSRGDSDEKTAAKLRGFPCCRCNLIAFSNWRFA
jgi:hypothetical protein